MVTPAPAPEPVYEETVVVQETQPQSPGYAPDAYAASYAAAPPPQAGYQPDVVPAYQPNYAAAAPPPQAYQQPGYGAGQNVQYSSANHHAY